MDKQLNSFLTQIEQHLQDVEVDKKAQVMLNLSDQIKEAAKNRSMDQVINDMGGAQSVANNIRVQNNLKTIPKKKNFSFFRWFFSILTFLFVTSIIAGSIIIWKFTPVFKIDEEKNRIILLGGLVDINGTSGRVKMMDSYHYVDNTFTNSFDGSIPINNKEFDELVLNFKSGQINIDTHSEAELSWKCKLDSPPQDEFINKNRGIIEIDLETLEGIACDIMLPSQMKLSIDAKDGQISIKNTDSDVYVEMENGQINFSPNPELEYKYEVDLNNGQKSDFISSSEEDAIEVSLVLKNGSIILED